MEKTGLCETDFLDGETCTKEELLTGKAVNHFHSYIRRALKEEREGALDAFVQELFRKNPDLVIVSTELGYGIVPIDAFDRLYREKVGRILCKAVEQAEEVSPAWSSEESRSVSKERRYESCSDTVSSKDGGKFKGALYRNHRRATLRGGHPSAGGENLSGGGACLCKPDEALPGDGEVLSIRRSPSGRSRCSVNVISGISRIRTIWSSMEIRTIRPGWTAEEPCLFREERAGRLFRNAAGRAF